MRPRRLLSLVALLIAAAAVPAFGYLKLGTRVETRTATLKWLDFPIRYYVTDRGAAGVSAPQMQAAVSRAFETWDAVETAETSSQFGGLTRADPTAGDSMTVIGFAHRPDLDRVLGATSFIIDVTTGEIVEADIFLNTRFPWSVAGSGEAGRQDVESIAAHEIGHLLGLGHSALGETEMIPGGRRVLGAEAVMFPIAFAAGSVRDRSLKADDIAGLTDLYGTTASRRELGSLSGRVTKNGQGVLGAHIVAFNPNSGRMVGGFTLDDEGTFTIAGLEPGPHVLRVEPLDDAEVDAFLDASLDVDLDFRVRFHDRIVTVPRGGGARDIRIQVTPK